MDNGGENDRDALERRVALLEAELAHLKRAFLTVMADPPLTRADRDLILAEAMARLEDSAQEDAKPVKPRAGG